MTHSKKTLKTQKINFHPYFRRRKKSTPLEIRERNTLPGPAAPILSNAMQAGWLMYIKNIISLN